MDAIAKLTHDVPLRLRNVPGTMPILKQLFEENLGLLDRILDLDSDTDLARRERAVNLVAIGDRWILLGETQKALTAYDESFEVAGRPGQGAPESPPVPARPVGGVRSFWARAYLALGRTSESLQAYEQAMAMGRQFAASDPSSRVVRRDLWLGLDKLGGVYLKLGRTDDCTSRLRRRAGHRRETRGGVTRRHGSPAGLFAVPRTDRRGASCPRPGPGRLGVLRAGDGPGQALRGGSPR